MADEGEASPGRQARQNFRNLAHSHGLLDGLRALRRGGRLHDVVLLVEGRPVPAHRVLLAASCDYFRSEGGGADGGLHPRRLLHGHDEAAGLHLHLGDRVGPGVCAGGPGGRRPLAAGRGHRLLLRVPLLLAGPEQRAGGARPGRRLRAAAAPGQGALLPAPEHPDLLPDRRVPPAAPGRGLPSAEQRPAAGEQREAGVRRRPALPLQPGAGGEQPGVPAGAPAHAGRRPLLPDGPAPAAAAAPAPEPVSAEGRRLRRAALPPAGAAAACPAECRHADALHAALHPGIRRPLQLRLQSERRERVPGVPPQLGPVEDAAVLPEPPLVQPGRRRPQQLRLRDRRRQEHQRLRGGAALLEVRPPPQPLVQHPASAAAARRPLRLRAGRPSLRHRGAGLRPGVEVGGAVRPPDQHLGLCVSPEERGVRPRWGGAGRADLHLLWLQRADLPHRNLLLPPRDQQLEPLRPWARGEGVARHGRRGRPPLRHRWKQRPVPIPSGCSDGGPFPPRSRLLVDHGPPPRRTRRVRRGRAGAPHLHTGRTLARQRKVRQVRARVRHRQRRLEHQRGPEAARVRAGGLRGPDAAQPAGQGQRLGPPHRGLVGGRRRGHC